MRNARIAGVAGRADTVTADATAMPLADASYDAAISSYAIDHMGREGTPRAIREVARVLKPNGEFLLEIVNPDVWTWVMMPLPHVGLNAHFRPDPARWRTMLKEAGFEVIEEGTAPATMYWLARKKKAVSAFAKTAWYQADCRECYSPPAAARRMPSVTMPTFSTPAPLAASITATMSP